MGDTEPGSSTAAQSAPTDPISRTQTTPRATARKRSKWLGRMAKAFSSKPTTQTDATGAKSVPQTALIPRPGMMNLRRMRVDDVAIPKAEIVAVPSDIKKDDLVEVFRESGMTRLPVYKGTLDTPVGLVHLKDFALNHGFNGKGERFNLKKMLRPLLYAPPSMPIGVLLQKMQSDRMHMALVIDEYGGVDGLVTLEDLVEQVIGEIEDEHDIDEDVFWTQSAPGVFVVQAKAPLDEFEAAIDMRLTTEEDEEEIDTLGGLVFLLCGRVPARGEVIPHPSGAEFEIIDADPRRIKRIRVRLPSAVKPKAEA
ncbi:MAG: hemolysin family protein [Alphaproteobacteria bacterium]|jgi:magnesium and cobalt transporter|uniref:Magnesium and cobalt transporter n=1 Tax=Celeribacter baekdonensis TaxID=875171 RepID=A0A1G7JNM7_9RHOB|nr:hemolysin family protein [Celeribacter baekdonensis]MBU0642026.1 hemolysin family protein [Alphaproteobacteria bacterium]MBU1281562.1 hemolysin family protein [Alphaproteobacteria bacterium]MBU1573563.1 hemolysin family protein [Alphaproteobacteria bacterium]MBU1828710.1 hemolysin family protein [Alphaproteobacteria bacterium]MBU2077447.1 hemolysin family protein [Alphaproteobacteria bacterium]